ncbi:UDP-N-acetylmuramate dehydrogenase [Permianibacter sp. IMCC34836]|uniref:UDP-N-acetylmuramate dehydrogenase n=1 Tax=Permianibacter fluminis TaxID=2738515 RepID=UPI001554FB3C|nr:UDP-N-acetylmuramate dehydrogenase [Permianibacter fluminis]NQD38392.1 UDP-N-acetylmuramate dehydrogenase [Permianibacter fluminis]
MILPNAALTNTFGLQVRAKQFVQAHSLDSLRTALVEAQRSNLPLLILGGGSNFLFVAPQLDAFVIQPALTGIRYTAIADNDVLVTAGAGEVWHQLVLASLEQGLCGLENLALIPGSVGAAPIQNIGAYGVELADCLVSVQAMEIASGNLRHFHKTELQLGYRDSVFKRALKDQYLITEITLLLHRQAPLKTDYDSLAKELAKQAAAPTSAQPKSGLTARQVADAVMAVRRARLPDPAVLGNAGSFFKNPVVSNATANALLQRYPAMPHYPQPDGSVKLAAGWLIEQAGMKGIRRGQAGTHESQALVIVNLGAATGADLLAVAREVRDTVQQQFGVTLEPEVWIIGATL